MCLNGPEKKATTTTPSSEARTQTDTSPKSKISYKCKMYNIESIVNCQNNVHDVPPDRAEDVHVKETIAETLKNSEPQILQTNEVNQKNSLDINAEKVEASVIQFSEQKVKCVDEENAISVSGGDVVQIGVASSNNHNNQLIENMPTQNNVNEIITRLEDEKFRKDGHVNIVSVHKVNDISSDAKHALTPLNIVSQQTHSPQLPIPSPNYPVQTQVMQATIDIPNPAQSGCSNLKLSDDKVQLSVNSYTTQLPNTYVPIINNNYINSPHSTSQNDVGKNSCASHSILMNGQNDSLKNKTDKVKATWNRTLKTCEDSNKKELNKNMDTPKIADGKTFINSIPLPKTNRDGNGFTVLNVPNVNFQPPAKKPKLSKIDIATMRKKHRREKRMEINNDKVNKENINKLSDNQNRSEMDFGIRVYGYSDSSNSSVYSTSEYDSECSDIDINITSGPPLKLDDKPEKLNFLQIFGLTTHKDKNSK